MTVGGVNPLSETVCILTVCGLLKKAVHSRLFGGIRGDEVQHQKAIHDEVADDIEEMNRKGSE